MGERADDVMARHPDADDEVDVFVDDAADTEGTTAYEAADEADDVEATRAQIEQTRAEMTDTIDAIKEKLNPEVLVQQAKESVREATIGRAQDAVSQAMDTARDAVNTAGDRARGASATMWKTIKENPVPVALTGVGLGWLYMNARRQPSHSVQRYQEYRYNYPASGYPAGTYPGGTYASGAYPTSASMPAQQPYVGVAPERHEGVVERAQEKAGEIAERAQEKAGEIAERVHETASHLGHGARQKAGDAGDWFQRLVSENPLPAAMAGISLTWLCLSARSQNATHDVDYPYRHDYAMSPGTLASGQAYSGATGSGAAGVVDSAREKVGEVADTARETVGRVAETARERAGEIAGRVQGRVSDLGQQARLKADRTGDWFQRTWQENPLALAAAVAGIGMLVGLSIPGTYREDRLMGETKDRLVDRARDAAQDVAGKVQTVAHEAIDTAKEQARDMGLTPQSATQAPTSGTAGMTTSAMDQDLAAELEEEETSTDVMHQGPTPTI